MVPIDDWPWDNQDIQTFDMIAVKLDCRVVRGSFSYANR